ncbi:hypothetical protein Tco_1479082, partial [Tanacetum coccineum]
ESEFHLATTTQLIRLQNDMQRDTLEGEKMFKKIKMTIEARNDVIEARKNVKENLDGLGQRLTECKASTSNLRRIQVKYIVKEIKDYLKTYSSSGMDISWYVKGIRCGLRRVRGDNTLMILLPFEEEQVELSFSE